MTQKHYVVICDWAYRDERGNEIKGIAHSLGDAKQSFNEFVKEEKEFANENDWEIYTDTEECFDAGEDGWYDNNHTCLYIKEVD